MTRLFATLAISAAAAALGSCAGTMTTASSDGGVEQLTDEQMVVLDRNIGGRVAGEPIRCLPGSAQGIQTIRVSDTILLYRQSGRLVYRNDLRGPCPGLARDDDILVFRNVGGGTASCRGDIFTLVDRTSGIQGGACVLGDFTPYRAPRSE